MSDNQAQRYLADCPQPVQDYVVKLVNDERERCAAQLEAAALAAQQAAEAKALTRAAAMVRGGA